jgi:hypothetical protein
MRTNTPAKQLQKSRTIKQEALKSTHAKGKKKTRTAL